MYQILYLFNVTELDEFYEEDMMISNTSVVPHVEKWETVKCSFVVQKFLPFDIHGNQI